MKEAECRNPIGEHGSQRDKRPNLGMLAQKDDPKRNVKIQDRGRYGTKLRRTIDGKCSALGKSLLIEMRGSTSLMMKTKVRSFVAISRPSKRCASTGHASYWHTNGDLSCINRANLDFYFSSSANAAASGSRILPSMFSDLSRHGIRFPTTTVSTSSLTEHLFISSHLHHLPASL